MGRIQERHQQILSWLDEAKEIITSKINNELDIQEKTNPSDLVTEVDKEVEKFFVDKINSYWPEDQILGEEGYGDQHIDLNRGTTWIIDPIDGTLNFVKQRENFAIMIGIYENSHVQQGYIYNVMRDELVYAIKGYGVYCNDQPVKKPEDLDLHEGLYSSSSIFYIGTKELNDFHYELAKDALGVRSKGSAGLEAVELAKGNTVGYTAHTLMPWDIAAGKVIVDELGLKMTNFAGEEPSLIKRESIIMGTPKAHATLLKKLVEMNKNHNICG